MKQQQAFLFFLCVGFSLHNGVCRADSNTLGQGFINMLNSWPFAFVDWGFVLITGLMASGICSGVVGSGVRAESGAL